MGALATCGGRWRWAGPGVVTIALLLAAGTLSVLDESSVLHTSTGTVLRRVAHGRRVWSGSSENAHDAEEEVATSGPSRPAPATHTATARAVIAPQSPSAPARQPSPSASPVAPTPSRAPPSPSSVPPSPSPAPPSPSPAPSPPPAASPSRAPAAAAGGGGGAAAAGGGRPARVLVTMFDTRPLDAAWEGAGYHTLSALVNRAYARAHGYAFRLATLPPGATAGLADKPLRELSNRAKVASVWDALTAPGAPHYDAVIYIDSDAVFRAFNVSLDDHVAAAPAAASGNCAAWPAPGVGLSFMSNWPDVPAAPNAGFFVVATSPAAGGVAQLRQWLEAVSAHPSNAQQGYYDQDPLWVLTGHAGTRNPALRLRGLPPSGPAVAPDEPALTPTGVCVWGEKPFADYAFLDPRLNAGRSWQWVRHLSSWPPEAAKRVPEFGGALRAMGMTPDSFADTVREMAAAGEVVTVDLPAVDARLAAEVARIRGAGAGGEGGSSGGGEAPPPASPSPPPAAPSSSGTPAAASSSASPLPPVPGATGEACVRGLLEALAGAGGSVGDGALRSAVQAACACPAAGGDGGGSGGPPLELADLEWGRLRTALFERWTRALQAARAGGLEVHTGGVTRGPLSSWREGYSPELAATSFGALLTPAWLLTGLLTVTVHRGALCGMALAGVPAGAGGDGAARPSPLPLSAGAVWVPSHAVACLRYTGGGGASAVWAAVFARAAALAPGGACGSGGVPYGAMDAAYRSVSTDLAMGAPARQRAHYHTSESRARRSDGFAFYNRPTPYDNPAWAPDDPRANYYYPRVHFNNTPTLVTFVDVFSATPVVWRCRSGSGRVCADEADTSYVWFADCYPHGTRAPALNHADAWRAALAAPTSDHFPQWHDFEGNWYHRLAEGNERALLGGAWAAAVNASIELSDAQGALQRELALLAAPPAPPPVRSRLRFVRRLHVMDAHLCSWPDAVGLQLLREAVYARVLASPAPPQVRYWDDAGAAAVPVDAGLAPPLPLPPAPPPAAWGCPARLRAAPVVVLTKRSTTRTLPNAAALEAALRSVPGLNVTLFDDAHLPSPRESWRLFARADMVVAQNGAALANLVSGRPGVHLFEVLADSWAVWHYAHMATALGFVYHRFVVPTTAGGGIGANFEAPVDALMTALCAELAARWAA